MRLIIKRSFLILASALFLVGCSNKINQTGAWLVSSDSSLAPVHFNSVADSAKVTTSQVNTGLATGASPELVMGKVPWTEADLLIRFSALDPVDSAQTILSTTITLYRGSYLLQPEGANVDKMKFAGYSMNGRWNYTTYTWDSVSALGYGTKNIITNSTVTDTTVELEIDTSVVRQWVIATQDTNVPNNGLIVKPLEADGIFSVYGPVYGVTGSVPICEVRYIKNGTLDTTDVALSTATSVAQTSIVSMAPQGPYRIIQAGTGERENIVFDLSSIPRYSIVNQATLTLYSDSTGELPFTRAVGADSLAAYYAIDPATGQFSTSYPGVGFQVGNEYSFDVTMLVQHMLNTQNNGFMITMDGEFNNTDARFMYDENAPDSLKPKLTVTYTPTSRR